MRALVVLLTIALAAIPAAANDVVVGQAAKAAAKSGLNVSARPVDASCDAACLAKVGTELGVQRVIALTNGKGGTIGVTVVDVEGQLVIGTKDLKKKDVASQLAKTVDALALAKAKALFAEANQHYSLGEFDKAMEIYSLAYRIKAVPASLFNIAQCHRKLGHYKEAVAMYQNYLVGMPDASNKDIVESLISEAQDRQVEADKKAADEAKMAADLEKKRLETEQKTADDARKAKEAEARAAEERRKADAQRIEHEKETYNRHPARKWMIMTAVLGAAGMGAGGYFGVQAKSQQDKFDSLGCGDTTQLLGAAALAQCKSYKSTGQKDSTLASSLLIGGGAVLAVATIVFAIDPGNVERPSTTVAVSPSSIDLVVHW
jgi:tetratricopeptide (TPR) repeat protein